MNKFDPADPTHEIKEGQTTLAEFKKFDKPKRDFVQVEENNTVELKVIDPNIIPSKSADYSDTLEVEHDGKTKLLSLPTVLRSTIEAMIKEGVLNRGTILKITNKGRVPKKRYFDFDVEYA